MAEIHKCMCDKCFELGIMKKDSDFNWINYSYSEWFQPPKGWSIIRGETLCERCTKEFKAYREKFFK